MEELYPPDFMPVHLDIIRTSELLSFDLYLCFKSGRTRKYVLYKKSGLNFTEEDKRKLQDNHVRTLFIPADEIPRYQEYISAQLSNMETDAIDSELNKKAALLYESTAFTMRDIFENPLDKTRIEQIANVVDQVIDSMTHNARIIKTILDIASHDYFTYTHSVNVFALTIGFSYRLGYRDRKLLQDIGIGSLMHDVGKRNIDRRILQKPGKLEPDEWSEIERHPLYSSIILRSMGYAPTKSREIVVQHHEKVDGSGYPYGLVDHEISRFAKITCIADVFDALTTNRPYKAGISPFKAVKVMLEEMSHGLDLKLLKGFINFLSKSP